MKIVKKSNIYVDYVRYYILFSCTYTLTTYIIVYYYHHSSALYFMLVDLTAVDIL